MSIERTSGILLHVSSLPNKYGIGTFGKEAYEFVDFLRKSGQGVWQILPLNPVAEGNSPYSTYSAFALNPYFIDLELLTERRVTTRKSIYSYGFWQQSCKSRL